MTERSIDSLGPLQRAVMEHVWEMEEATVHQVRKRFGRRKKPAYTTVLTVMRKLEELGWLRHRTEGRTYVYRPTHSRERAHSRSVRRLVERVFRGDPLLLFQNIISEHDLTEEELDELRRMIDRKRGERREE